MHEHLPHARLLSRLDLAYNELILVGWQQWKGQGINWLNWDKMAVRKEFEGMGFRHLFGFNLAILAKQGWKLISNPNTTIVRIFKTKYYPQGVFLEAALGHNSSFDWRSIQAFHVLVRRGLKWRIGDGKRINIGKDLWLRAP